ncbi:MAG: peptide deformylase [Deltaproteobacteria bacterium]|nr:peptide deformylase [Deltaproteobacteria bacterium]MBW2661965.1 peptide deformylase [Deltaproteobacteria bacterium]
MAILTVLTYPDKFLSQSAKPVKNIDGATQNIIEDMSLTMYKAPGVGLAAMQVGFDQSIIVYDISPKDENRSLHVLINPKIISSEGTTISENEGCLSVPDYRADVKRSDSILVEGFDRKEKPLRIEAHGFLAVVLQHEIDHLSGILFINRISSLKRSLYKRHIKKMLRQK